MRTIFFYCYWSTLNRSVWYSILFVIHLLIYLCYTLINLPEFILFDDGQQVFITVGINLCLIREILVFKVTEIYYCSTYM